MYLQIKGLDQQTATYLIKELEDDFMVQTGESLPGVQMIPPDPQLEAIGMGTCGISIELTEVGIGIAQEALGDLARLNNWRA